MNKKGSYFIIAILVICCIILIIFKVDFSDKKVESNVEGNIDNNQETVEETLEYLLIDNMSNWQYDEGKWSSVNPNSIEKQKFYVYLNNQYSGLYNLEYGKKWKLFDDDSRQIVYNEDLLAVSYNSNIKIKDITKTEVTDTEKQEISNILNINHFNYVLSTNEVLLMDLNSNGISDKIVCVHNLYSENQDDYFLLVYVELDGNIIVLKEEKVEINDTYSVPVYYIRGVMNVDNNEYDSIILHKVFYSYVGEAGNILYDYSGANYEISIEDGSEDTLLKTNENDDRQTLINSSDNVKKEENKIISFFRENVFITVLISFLVLALVIYIVCKVKSKRL